jgi:hypothetical protein
MGDKPSLVCLCNQEGEVFGWKYAEVQFVCIPSICIVFYALLLFIFTQINGVDYRLMTRFVVVLYFWV